ncbi:sigma 54-interacting transcriptional regulator [bacterium]|nr:sigma 54-interacting transcriptional regulator [bacterium]
MEIFNSNSYDFSELIGNSQLLQKAKNLAEKVIEAESVSALIIGETGTGKGLLAKIIHNNSSRKNEPFIEINCATIPENLIESEIFGHEKGAFTDAKTSKKGLFEVADKGTVFLDEIGDMPLILQTKLLKAIEEKSFRRVGGTEDINVDIRILAGTNKNLVTSIEKKTFRSDLFYRLNTITIELPPLRKRGDDLEILAYHFLHSFAFRHSKEISRISGSALTLIKNYTWFGNIRELRNVIERAILMADSDCLEIKDFDLEIDVKNANETFEEKIYALLRQSFQEIFENLTTEQSVNFETVEKAIIASTLEFCNWNKSLASKFLEMPRPRLDRMIEKHNLLKENFENEDTNKVLIVDDNQEFLDFLALAIKNEGFEVETALNGLQAYEIFENFKAKFVVTDILLPKLNGLDLAKKLREAANPKIIFVTEKLKDEHLLNSLKTETELYGYKFFEKPFHFAELLKLLKDTQTTE